MAKEQQELYLEKHRVKIMSHPNQQQPQKAIIMSLPKRKLTH
jgi:hypothetical protein